MTFGFLKVKSISAIEKNYMTSGKKWIVGRLYSTANYQLPTANSSYQRSRSLHKYLLFCIAIGEPQIPYIGSGSLAYSVNGAIPFLQPVGSGEYKLSPAIKDFKVQIICF